MLLSLLDRTQGAVASTVEDGAAVSAATPGDAVRVDVPEGSSADDIVSLLLDAGVLRDGDGLRVLLTLTGVGADLQAGAYEFAERLPAGEVWYILRQGPNLNERITFREGLRVEEIGLILEAEEMFSAEEWNEAVAEDRAERHLEFLDLRPEGADLTGYLLPATYEVEEEMTALQLLEAMLDAFWDNISDEWLADAEAQGWTLHEVLTLAAIVEREAVHPEEQAIVASVFRNRLVEGMPLQADPTVQYAITVDPTVGEENIEEYGYWKRELSINDLEIDSIYNTYIYPGLPPGPIANPGIGAIEATIYPEETNYFYFVAHPDCDGRHLFAETLEEHNENVEEFIASGCGQEEPDAEGTETAE